MKLALQFETFCFLLWTNTKLPSLLQTCNAIYSSIRQTTVIHNVVSFQL